ncbi:MAG: T9SS type A sorting domain-containing protein [Flavobacteriales bacterium]|nr:T9SS type A sorting domain-containing protein [Flavobacteriales bacterium]
MDISLYPNTNKENIIISLQNFNGNIQYEVYDLIGNRLQISNENTLSLQYYAKGIYILKVAYGDRLEEVKVVKE